MNLISKFLNLIKLFYNAKLSLKKPKNKKILIYDNEGSDELIKHLPNKDIFILHVRGESINLWIFFLSIAKFNLNWTYSKYLNLYIQKINPEFILTFIDNNPEFYKLKKFFINSKLIFIQNGIRGYENDIFRLFKEKKINTNDLKVDEMFVWNEQTGINYKEYLKGNFHVIGSIKNNRIKKNDNIKKYEILFLSEFRNSSSFGKNLTWDNYFSIEKHFIPYLYSFTQKKNFKLHICSNSFDYDQEYLFYKNLIEGDNWELLKRTDVDSSYNYIDLSNVVVFISTAIGYESISRGTKTAAFTIRSEATNIRSHKFGWPYVYSENSGEFWTNFSDKKIFDNILNFLINEKLENFNELVKKKYNKLLPYDSENKILRQKFKEFKIN